MIDRKITAPEPAKDGPEVVGYLVGCPVQPVLEFADVHVPDAAEPLVRLSDYEALRAERDAALEAEDEAKDCFWAIYPDWVEMKGHGISTEAARTMLADQITALRAENERVNQAWESTSILLGTKLAYIAELVKALKPFADAIFNDNGDVTCNYAAFDDDDLFRAYSLLKRAALKGQSNEA